ncbi:MAG: hypothetical protein QOI76_334 [Frankiales bacterium]|nr:hypothetical protein [Frankiales bacterium]
MNTARPFASMVGALAVATLVTGCGSSSSGPAFTTQSGVQADAATQSCLVHQKSVPTADYKGGADGKTTDVLTFLAYYTANGNKQFCDGEPANGKDKAWAALYTSFAAAKNVRGITSR